MEVNRELPNLGDGLEDSVHLLTPGGRVLVLAYHSLEDRIVKQQFAEWAGTAPRSGHIPRGLPGAGRARAGRPAAHEAAVAARATTSSPRTRARRASRLRAAERLSS